jgi:hypothetical protein
MIFMLIAVTLFFILAGLFFLSFQLSGIRSQFLDIQEQNAKQLVSKLANTPELTCGRPNCIDYDRALLLKDKLEYRRFWQVDSIEVIRLYPILDNDIECNKGSYPNCNKLTIFENTGKDLIPRQSNFVQLCRKDSYEGDFYERCELGLLIVGFEGFEE